MGGNKNIRLDNNDYSGNSVKTSVDYLKSEYFRLINRTESRKRKKKRYFIKTAVRFNKIFKKYREIELKWRGLI